MGEEREYTKARDYAYRLLGYRQRTAAELRLRLEKKGFAASVIDKTVDYLVEINFVNDKEFARAWIQEHIRSRPQGRALLRYKLKRKGLDEDLIDDALEKYAADYDEAQAAKELARARAKKYSGIPALKVKQRLFGYLRRRGFSQDAVMRALEE